MSTPSAGSTAQVIDFADARRRRAERASRTVIRRRQFLWGWSTGPLTPVEFPGRISAAPSTTLTRGN